MDFACFSWWLPPSRWLDVARIIEWRKVIVSGSDHGDCKGFLTFPRRTTKRYSSGLLMACGSSSCVGCAAPDCGLGMWCLLAREPLSEWIATTGTSLLASKWTALKILSHIVSKDFIGIHCDWLIVSCHGGIASLPHSCTYFPSVAKLFSAFSFES
jgi:hypothetical protein